MRKLALLILAAVAAVVILALAGEDEEGENLRRYLAEAGNLRHENGAPYARVPLRAFRGS